MAALLDQPAHAAAGGDLLPPLWHWFYFLQWPPQQDLGDDGHPRYGHFLPPIPQRQRMFAGGRCEIAEPLLLGEPAQRISSLGTVVIHGPLLVLAMLELARLNAPDRRVRSLSYRLRRPAFVGEHLLASGIEAGGRADLRIATHREQRHATAEVTFE